MSPKSQERFPVHVVICWHMHQPEYQDHISGEYQLPWTYLHAIKDYTDMAEVLNRVPTAQAVVNFTPILLEQLDDYGRQFDRFFDEGLPFKDPLLRALASRHSLKSNRHREQIIRQCTRANEVHFINRYPSYRKLVDLANFLLANNEAIDYIEDQYIYDLLVWYHLAWLGETVKSSDPSIAELYKKAEGYRYQDRMLLLEYMRNLIVSVVPTYNALQNRGQIELSFTPDKHPIMPLLIDFENAHFTEPHAPSPKHKYPDGISRAEAHIVRGLEIFKQYFDIAPKGCWPAEGAVCEASLTLLQKYNIQWAASGGGVLHNSLQRNQAEGRCVHKPFRFKDIETCCFFRDDNLSDLIGFTYSGWHHQDAVKDLIHHLKNIRKACGYKKDTVVPIILDGENCWEYYERNGLEFLSELYARLSNEPDITLTTFSEYLTHDYQPDRLEHLVPGSWVYGNLATWIGNEDKNKAWDLLCEAKLVFDRVKQQKKLTESQLARAENQLAICEGSDWFWWFGDYNPVDSVQDFDLLYRDQLKALYRLLGEAPPNNLDQVISIGQGNPENDGVMRKST